MVPSGVVLGGRVVRGVESSGGEEVDVGSGVGWRVELLRRRTVPGTEEEVSLGLRTPKLHFGGRRGSGLGLTRVTTLLLVLNRGISQLLRLRSYPVPAQSSFIVCSDAPCAVQ